MGTTTCDCHCHIRSLVLISSLEMGISTTTGEDGTAWTCFTIFNCDKNNTNSWDEPLVIKKHGLQQWATKQEFGRVTNEVSKRYPSRSIKGIFSTLVQTYQPPRNPFIMSLGWIAAGALSQVGIRISHMECQNLTYRIWVVNICFFET